MELNNEQLPIIGYEKIVETNICGINTFYLECICDSNEHVLRLVYDKKENEIY